MCVHQQGDEMATGTVHAGAVGGTAPRGGPAAPRGTTVPGRDRTGGGRAPLVRDALEGAAPRWWRAGVAPPARRWPAVPPHGRAVAPTPPRAQAGRHGRRVRNRALDAAAHRHGGRADLWRAVPLPLAGARLTRPRLESPAAAPAGPRARRRVGRSVAAGRLAPHKKGA